MKSLPLFFVACVVVVALLMQNGCKPESRPGELRVSLPLSTQQILRDTSFTKTVDGVGTFRVSVRNAQLNVESVERLPKSIAWGIYSVQGNKSDTKKIQNPQNCTHDSRRFYLASFELPANVIPGVDVQGRVIPTLPHIKWSEGAVGEFGSGTDTTALYVGTAEPQ